VVLPHGSRPGARWVPHGFSLQGIAPAYDRARADGRPAPPDIFVVPRGAFDGYRVAAWIPGGRVRARPFAATWAEVVVRPGLGTLLTGLG
jgi:hypothetical protein